MEILNENKFSQILLTPKIQLKIYSEANNGKIKSLYFF